MTDPLKYYDNNLHGTMVLLSAMTAHGVIRSSFPYRRHLWRAGTGPHPGVGPHRAPTNCYGETKLAMERMMGWVSRAHGLRYVALRYFNACGAHRLPRHRRSPRP